MDVGDTGDAEALELVREARNDHIVPRDLDGGGLDEEAVAQRGGGDGAGGSDEELATGEGNRHRGKVTGAGRLPVTPGRLRSRSFAPSALRMTGALAPRKGKEKPRPSHFSQGTPRLVILSERAVCA